MTKIGIVGNGTDKFTEETKQEAFEIIEELLRPVEAVLVSGHSPVGGIDIWAEEVADALGKTPEQRLIFAADSNNWGTGYGFKARNIDIAKNSDHVHVIVVREYPPDYTGRRWDECYHCYKQRPPHVKSGACWTAKRAQGYSKPATWHILPEVE